jgi:DNA-binding Xre family transcriptional regulator
MDVHWYLAVTGWWAVDSGVYGFASYYENMKDIELETEINQVNNLFRKNLILLRASQALSGRDLSEKLLMSKNRINDLEEGRMPPTFSDLIKIVDFFPITFNDLLEYEITLDIKSRTNANF